jgi:hypothetical protein
VTFSSGRGAEAQIKNAVERVTKCDEKKGKRVESSASSELRVCLWHVAYRLGGETLRFQLVSAAAARSSKSTQLLVTYSALSADNRQQSSSSSCRDVASVRFGRNQLSFKAGSECDLNFCL